MAADKSYISSLCDDARSSCDDARSSCDDELLLPCAPILGPLIMFMCVRDTKITGLSFTYNDAVIIDAIRPKGAILAINTNYHHMAQPGYEHYLKPKRSLIKRLPVADKEATLSVDSERHDKHIALLNMLFGHITPKIKQKSRRTPSIKRRRREGDGTCFNWAIEPVIRIMDDSIEKIYYARYFPHPGTFQVTGGLRVDMSDTNKVTAIWIEHLNNAKISIDGSPPAIASENVLCRKINLYNCKFHINRRDTSRVILNIPKFFHYMQLYSDRLPFQLIKCEQGQTSGKIRFLERKIETPDSRLAKVTSAGKFNLLGLKNLDDARDVYDGIGWLLSQPEVWADSIQLKPLTDRQRHTKYIHIPDILLQASTEPVVPINEYSIVSHAPVLRTSVETKVDVEGTSTTTDTTTGTTTGTTTDTTTGTTTGTCTLKAEIDEIGDMLRLI